MANDHSVAGGGWRALDRHRIHDRRRAAAAREILPDPEYSREWDGYRERGAPQSRDAIGADLRNYGHRLERTNVVAENRGQLCRIELGWLQSDSHAVDRHQE